MFSIEKFLSCPLLDNVNVHKNAEVGDYAVSTDGKVFLIYGVEINGEYVNYDVFSLSDNDRRRISNGSMLAIPKKLALLLLNHCNLIFQIDDVIYYHYSTQLDNFWDNTENNIFTNCICSLIDIYYLNLLLTTTFNDRDLLDADERIVIKKICRRLKITNFTKPKKNSSIRIATTFDGSKWEIKKTKSSKMINRHKRQINKNINSHHIPRQKTTSYEFIRKL